MSVPEAALRRTVAGWGPGALALGGVACIEVIAAAGLSAEPRYERIVFGLGLLVVGGLACVVAPRRVLFLLAALWGPIHTILADFDITHVGALQLTVSRLVGICVLGGFGLALVAPSTTRREPLPVPLRALTVFGLVFLFAAGTAPSRANGLSDFVRVASGIVIGLVAFRVLTTREIVLKIARVVSIAGVVVASVTALQFVLIRVDPGLASQLFGASFYQRSYGTTVGQFAVRVNGPLGGPGETANFLVVAAAFSLMRYMLLRDEGRSTRQLLALSTICVGTMATLTRASIAALVVLLCGWALQRQLRSVGAAPLRLRVAGALALLLVLAVPFLGVGNLKARAGDVNPISSGSGFAQGRGTIWAEELAKLRDAGKIRLLIGQGAHSSYVDVVGRGVIVQESPHNLPLWLLVETGLAGFLTYAIFYVGTLKYLVGAAVRRRFEWQGQLAAVGIAAIVAYTVLDLFILTINSPGNRWYFMILVGAAMRAAARETAADGNVAPGRV